MAAANAANGVPVVESCGPQAPSDSQHPSRDRERGTVP